MMKNIVEESIHLLGGNDFLGQFAARFILLTLLLKYSSYANVRSIYFHSYQFILLVTLRKIANDIRSGRSLMDSNGVFSGLHTPGKNVPEAFQPANHARYSHVLSKCSQKCKLTPRHNPMLLRLHLTALWQWQYDVNWP